jgi:hypothetical protein
MGKRSEKVIPIYLIENDLTLTVADNNNKRDYDDRGRVV